MRNDFQEVVKFKSSHRTSFRSAKGDPLKKLDQEDLPTVEAIKAHVRGEMQHPSVHFSPVRRYLDKQVGRKWDDVYSDLSRNNRDRSFTQSLKKLIQWHVFLDVVMIDGVPHEKGDHHEYSEIGRYRSQNVLYVDPETKRLASHKGKKYVPEVKPVEFILIKNDVEPPIVTDRDVVRVRTGYRKIEGIWYFVKESYESADRWYTRMYPYRGVVFTKVKRQLNKKELKELGLINTPKK